MSTVLNKTDIFSDMVYASLIGLELIKNTLKSFLFTKRWKAQAHQHVWKAQAHQHDQ